MDQEQIIASSSHEVPKSWEAKLPRLVDCPSPLPGLASAYDPSKPDLLVSCKGWTWACHRDVLAKQCAFFRACCQSGFREQESHRINIDDDEPKAVQALLRYIYTLSPQEAFRKCDPLFSDVERDLDIYVIADKYELQPLKKYMNDKLVIFYETDKTPPLDPKGWSAKNQIGFGNVLMKLYRLEVDTTDIRKAITNFIVRAGQKVMQWEGVRKAIEEDAQLSTDLIMAFFAAKRGADGRIENLENEVRDLEQQLAQTREENEELEGETEYLSGLVRNHAFETVSPNDFEEQYYETDPYDPYLYGPYFSDIGISGNRTSSPPLSPGTLLMEYAVTRPAITKFTASKPTVATKSTGIKSAAKSTIPVESADIEPTAKSANMKSTSPR